MKTIRLVLSFWFLGLLFIACSCNNLIPKSDIISMTASAIPTATQTKTENCSDIVFYQAGVVNEAFLELLVCPVDETGQTVDVVGKVNIQLWSDNKKTNLVQLFEDATIAKDQFEGFWVKLKYDFLPEPGQRGYVVVQCILDGQTLVTEGPVYVDPGSCCY